VQLAARCGETRPQRKRKRGEDSASSAAQWVIALRTSRLTTFQGANGLAVFAPPYASAKPLSGVKLTLVARETM